MNENKHALVLQSVNKWYGDHHAVKDLNFHVERGEIFGILGPNGAGKTTTIRMILDIIKPDQGHIEIFGSPFSEELKNRIGYLPEERGLYRNVPLIQLLAYLGQLKDMSHQAAVARARDLLQRVGLGEYEKSKVNALSKGMAQKVQFITTILHQPELIIIDEPFSGLDPVNTQMIKDMLFEMRDQGATIMMSTHQMYQLEAMADRILMISQGERVLYGQVDEVRQLYAQNAVVVEGQGQWSALPGVTEVEKGQRNGEVILHLADGIQPDQIMASLANSPDYHIQRFELAIPSLDEIFIQVVEQQSSSKVKSR